MASKEREAESESTDEVPGPSTRLIYKPIMRGHPPVCSRLEADGNRWSSREPQPHSSSQTFQIVHGQEHVPFIPTTPTKATAHPLYNHVILQSVFDLLQVEDLKSCRQVCKLWDDLATPPMLSKGVISINAEDTEGLAGLKGWMNSSPWELRFFGEKKSKLFTNFSCDKITRESYPNIWDMLGSQVKHFTVSHWWNDSRDLLLQDYEHLLLKQCPNLEEINIPSTKNFRIAKDFLSGAVSKNNKHFLKLKTLVLTGETKPSPKFWRIVNLSPDLKTLKVYCPINEEFWNPFPYRKVWDERMCNLKILEVKSFGNESITDDSGDYFMTRKWTLESITCEMYIVADSILRVCYDNIADTLQSLNITFFNKHCDHWSLDRVQEGFLSPRMVNMKHWRFGIDDHCTGPVFARNFLTAISLPNLISFRMFPYEEECNDEWPDGLFGQMMRDTYHDESKFPLRPSLKILTLPPRFQDQSCIDVLSKICPNIKELELHTPSAPILSQILANWTKLERLKILLSDDDSICWTSVLIGGKSILRRIPSRGRESVESKASISNLKNLNSLEIELNGDDSDSDCSKPLKKHPINDSLIHYGLVELPTIQNIVVRGNSFSPAAVDSLRKAIPMFCHIDFGKN